MFNNNKTNSLGKKKKTIEDRTERRKEGWMDGRKEGGEKEDGCMNDKSVTGSEKSPFRYIPESPEMITEPLKVTILRRISSIQTPKP